MENIAIIYLILSSVTLIVFFVMARNVAAIRKTLDELISSDHPTQFTAPFNLAKIRDYQGRKQVALELFYEAYYKLDKHIKAHPKDPQNSANKKLIEDKIASLGGVIRELQ